MLTIPTWLSEKRHSVNPTTTVPLAVATAVTIFIALGYFAASSEHLFATTDDDITTVLSASPRSHDITKFASFVFPPVVLWSGIPVCAIVVRYNLIAEGFLEPQGAQFVSAVTKLHCRCLARLPFLGSASSHIRGGWCAHQAAYALTLALSRLPRPPPHLFPISSPCFAGDRCFRGSSRWSCTAAPS